MVIWVSRKNRRPIVRLDNPSPEKLRELRGAGYLLIPEIGDAHANN